MKIRLKVYHARLSRRRFVEIRRGFALLIINFANSFFASSSFQIYTRVLISRLGFSNEGDDRVLWFYYISFFFPRNKRSWINTRKRIGKNGYSYCNVNIEGSSYRKIHSHEEVSDGRRSAIHFNIVKHTFPGFLSVPAFCVLHLAYVTANTTPRYQIPTRFSKTFSTFVWPGDDVHVPVRVA